MKIGILTSSRADYGILKPLIKKLSLDDFFNIKLIVFGTHLIENYGYTLNEIINDGFSADFKLYTTPKGDSPSDISNSIGETIKLFSKFWSKYHNHFDLVLCLGDRFEMFAAITSSIPFNIKIAHLHGGETTLGSIDNFFRHSITLASNLHFTSTKCFSKKVEYLIGSKKNIYNVGALSLDSMQNIKLYSLNELNEKFSLKIMPKTILITIHPETIFPENNLKNLDKVFDALISTNSSALFSLPNADTFGGRMRDKILKFSSEHKNIITNEHFGTIGYFSAMKHCAFLLGNTSSGIIEAASLKKYVINIGDRQKGRVQNQNIINCSFDTIEIIDSINKVTRMSDYDGINIYYKPNVADNIISILKENYEKL